MIIIDKLTQILKILYPKGVDAACICEVYENIVPDVRKLIISVEIPQLMTHGIVPAVYDENTQPMTPPFKGPAHSAPSAHTEIEPRVTDDLDVVKPLRSDRGETLFFNENNKRHETDEDWAKTEYGGPIHYKYGDDIFIRGDSCTISTSWEYLNEFFDYLPDETVLMRVEGMNKKKLTTLFKFYEAHPNWSCHVEKSNGVNVFVKDEVRVNNTTAVSGDGGAMDVDSFNGVGRSNESSEQS